MESKYFANRRTVRTYSDRTISVEEIEEMLQLASHAPNTGNMQQYSAIITTDEEIRRRLAPAHFNQPTVMGCQAIVTFCLDFNRFEHWCRLNNATPGFNNFQAFTWGVIDTTILAQQFVTIAELRGMGTCYLGTTTYNAAAIAEVLELPDRVVPVVSVTVGWPEGEAAKSLRLPVEAIVHRQKYRDYSDEDIRRAYAEIEADPTSDKFIAENGKETLAQVFTDVRYPGSANEPFSRLYAEFIKKQGF